MRAPALAAALVVAAIELWAVNVVVSISASFDTILIQIIFSNSAITGSY
jgi:hypothetical protein